METGTQILGGVVWLGVTFGAAAVGARSMPDEWVRALKKPRWNPPNWIFAPVWTVLYLLMAAAAWLVWRRYGISAAVVPLGVFVVQLVLNALWSWLFFGRHQIGGALIEIVLLWLAIVATIVLFWEREPLAGILLLPYLAWVSFATVLNATLWKMNG